MLNTEVDETITALKNEKLDETIAKHFRENKKQFSFSEGSKRLIRLLENFKQIFDKPTLNYFWDFHLIDLKPYKNESGTSYLQVNFHSIQHEGYIIRATASNCNEDIVKVPIFDYLTIRSDYAIRHMEHQRNHFTIDALLREVKDVNIAKKCDISEDDMTPYNEKNNPLLHFRVDFMLHNQLFPEDAITKVNNLISVVHAYRKHLDIETQKVTQYAKELLGKKA